MDEHGYKITKIAIAITLFYILSYIPSLIENILVGIYEAVWISKLTFAFPK
jgi:hypothetical protein